MSNNVGAVAPAVVSNHSDVAPLNTSFTSQIDDWNESFDGADETQTPTLGEADNASGFSSMGPQLETNAHLNGVWKDSLGCVTADDTGELVSNIDTSSLKDVYGTSTADSIMKISELQPLTVGVAINLATGPLDEVGKLLDERPDTPLDQLTNGAGLTTATDMRDPHTTAVLATRHDLNSGNLNDMWSAMMADFKGNPGEAREAYEIALDILQSSSKVHPDEISDMVWQMFEAPKDTTKVTGKDVLDMMGMAEGMIANNASPKDVMDMINKSKNSSSQPPPNSDPSAPQDGQKSKDTSPTPDRSNPFGPSGFNAMDTPDLEG